ncbi:MAG: hypothetical protein HQL80_02540 [Magnetococcales bacterium]|nr:hypothetical protein [Magnetococcales bacterium]
MVPMRVAVVALMGGQDRVVALAGLVAGVMVPVWQVPIQRPATAVQIPALVAVAAFPADRVAKGW